MFEDLIRGIEQAGAEMTTTVEQAQALDLLLTSLRQEAQETATEADLTTAPASV